jgi:3D (Asp-Asp-Asp) domain-containing protein
MSLSVVAKAPWKSTFVASVDGADIVVRNVRATYFGGDNDPQDDGTTASGTNTKGNPNILGCAVPMNYIPECAGSPIPRIPWHTKVHVFCHETKKEWDVYLIDIGPHKPPHADAQIDLTVAAYKFLAGNLSDDITVDYRIIGCGSLLKGLK